MLNKTVIVMLVLFAFSCSNEKTSNESDEIQQGITEMTDLNWVSGQWIDSTSFKNIGQTYVESWEKISEDNYQGHKYAIKNGVNGDTTNLQLEKSEGKYYLTVSFEKEKSVFMERESSENSILFSNTKDEFPYDISYRKTKDSLQIEVSGVINGFNRLIKYNTVKQ